MSREAAVYIIHGGKQAGPFSVKQLKQQVASGNILRETLVWYKGLDDWMPLKEAFSESIDIPDIPRSQGGNTGMSLIREDVPALPAVLPDASSGKWQGPGSSGGRLFIPGDPVEEPQEKISTPQWEKREAARIRRRREWPPSVVIRLVIIVLLLVAIYWVWAHG